MENNEAERMWEEAGVTYVMVLYQKLKLMRGLSKGTLLSAEVNGNSWAGIGRDRFLVTIMKSDGLCKRNSSIKIRAGLNQAT